MAPKVEFCVQPRSMLPCGDLAANYASGYLKFEIPQVIGKLAFHFSLLYGNI